MDLILRFFYINLIKILVSSNLNSERGFTLIGWSRITIGNGLGLREGNIVQSKQDTNNPNPN